MNARECELIAKTTLILNKDTLHMRLVDIIAELCETVEKQENKMKLFLMEEK